MKSYKHKLSSFSQLFKDINSEINNKIVFEYDGEGESKKFKVTAIDKANLNSMVKILFLKSIPEALKKLPKDVAREFQDVVSEINTTIKKLLWEVDDHKFYKRIYTFIESDQHQKDNFQISASKDMGKEKIKLFEKFNFTCEGVYCCLKFSRISYKSQNDTFFDSIAIPYFIYTDKNKLHIFAGPMGKKHS